MRPLRAVLRYLWQIAHGRPGRYVGLDPAGAAMSVALLALLGGLDDQRLGADHGRASLASIGSRRLHTWSSNLVLILAAVRVSWACC